MTGRMHRSARKGTLMPCDVDCSGMPPVLLMQECRTTARGSKIHRTFESLV
jgi:hypothetical protein